LVSSGGVSAGLRRPLLQSNGDISWVYQGTCIHWQIKPLQAIMIEPVTIFSATNTLVSISFKLFSGINSLIGKYQGADILLGNLSSQCSVANSAFARIQTLLRDEPEFFARHVGEEVDFALNMENALIAAFRVFSALDNEIAKMGKGNTQKISKWARVKTSYNEGVLKERSRQLGDCCASIHFLLTVVTMYSSH
jgi:hypothetical protein